MPPDVALRDRAGSNSCEITAVRRGPPQSGGIRCRIGVAFEAGALDDEIPGYRMACRKCVSAGVCRVDWHFFVSGARRYCSSFDVEKTELQSALLGGLATDAERLGQGTD